MGEIKLVELQGRCNVHNRRGWNWTFPPRWVPLSTTHIRTLFIRAVAATLTTNNNVVRLFIFSISKGKIDLIQEKHISWS